VDPTPGIHRFTWGAQAIGWTLQWSTDLVTWTDVQPITAAGEWVPPFSAPRLFCRVRY
jgi:hypothetical protein